MSFDGILDQSHPWNKRPIKNREKSQTQESEIQNTFSGSIADKVFEDMIPEPRKISEEKDSVYKPQNENFLGYN